MNLGEMKRILAERDLMLTRSLGQNFLHDGNQLRRIIAAAELAPTDHVLEIGPGLGPLTELLLEKSGEVLAIEKDRRLVEFLRERFAGNPKLRLVHADALEYLDQNRTDWGDWKLVSNLPYSAASPMLVELARANRGPARMVATLQLEVAQRIAAAAGSDDYGLLALLLQLRYTPAGIFKIPAGCFFPAPDVDSACITLLRRDTSLLDAAGTQMFERVVRRGFSQRRKQMLKLLREEWPEAALTAAFERLNLPREIRAEQVSLAQFVELARSLN